MRNFYFFSQLCSCVGVIACRYAWTSHDVWCLQRSEEEISSSGTGVVDVCEAPHGCWESNLVL